MISKGHVDEAVASGTIGKTPLLLVHRLANLPRSFGIYSIDNSIFDAHPPNSHPERPTHLDPIIAHHGYR